MTYETLKVRVQDSICRVQIDRPDAQNTINEPLIREFHAVLDACEESVTVLVVSGSTEVFCMGADFKALSTRKVSASEEHDGPGAMYDLWLRLSTGPYITIAQVRGKANAGGIGFVAASDIVIADPTAQFSLSELLFGLYPACVLPFLVRRVGFQKAHYLTLMTQPISGKQAWEWGLVDALDADSEAVVRRHLLRLRRLSKTAIRRYKTYMNRLAQPLSDLKALAVAGNLEVFTDPLNIQAMTRYVERGVFPWE